jgi:pantoate--beta-alanine ligase
MANCLVGLGSNLGDRAQSLLQALAALGALPGVCLLRHSALVETAADGGPPGQGAYLNAAALLETSLSPAELLAALGDIERRLGRMRGERWGPRTIDLDLLLYGDAVVNTDELTLPHPRLNERAFVLQPAAEIAAQMVHPLLERSIAELLAALPPGECINTGMRVVTAPGAMQSAVLKLRREGQRIGLVPTMGALHEGHLSLVRTARRRADVVVATIFVNPTQFGPREDFSKYPRTLEEDLRALSREGCQFVFVPDREAMYPEGFSTYVEPPAVAGTLEGACRPGHFRGVATVVLKLFNIVPADIACFGQKDFQQLRVIERMARDLDLPIEIVCCPIVREADGLAMSSRNRYLSPAERQQALALSRSLAEAERLLAAGERDGGTIREAMRKILTAAGIERIDYVAICDPDTLAEKPRIDGPAVALIAAFVGGTRLIDNALLGGA